MNWLNKVIARLECSVIGHKIHSEVSEKDYGVFTIHQRLITCSNCGKFYGHSSRISELTQLDSHEIKDCRGI